MPVVTIIVGAIANAMGASILATAVATGIAGGIVAAATGGKFADGFKSGAIGGLASGIFSAGMSSFGSTSSLGGATQFADGTTSAEMFAAQGGAEFAPTALEGVGDAAASGMGDVAGGMAGTETFGMGETIAPQGTALDAGASPPAWETGLQADVNAAQTGFNAEPTSLASSAGFGAEVTPSMGGDQFAMLPDTPMAADYSLPDGGAAPASWAGDAGTPVEGSYPMSYAESAAPAATQESGGLGGMFKSSDAWLKDNLGMPKGSTGKLLMGGADSLMKMYEANKMERRVKGMAPLSFEQFQSQYSDPNAYKVAANRMAKSGRTGTLPVLLARMKNDVRGKYASYLPGAQQQQLNNEAGVSALKTSSLNNLFAPYAQNAALQGY